MFIIPFEKQRYIFPLFQQIIPISKEISRMVLAEHNQGKNLIITQDESTHSVKIYVSNNKGQITIPINTFLTLYTKKDVFLALQLSLEPYLEKYPEIIMLIYIEFIKEKLEEVIEKIYTHKLLGKQDLVERKLKSVAYFPRHRQYVDKINHNPLLEVFPNMMRARVFRNIPKYTKDIDIKGQIVNVSIEYCLSEFLLYFFNFYHNLKEEVNDRSRGYQ